MSESPANSVQGSLFGRAAAYSRYTLGTQRLRLIRMAARHTQHVAPRPAGAEGRLRILYLSCHVVLEHDETSLLRELGHYVFSPGTSAQGVVKAFDLRDITPTGTAEEAEDWEHFQALGPDPLANMTRLTSAFVDRFDLVMVMHVPGWIERNWWATRRRPVIWRTIGQSDGWPERILAPYRRRGLKILRYSPAEERIPFYIGADALIRFYKDPEEYCCWNGARREIMCVNQSLPARPLHCHYDVFRETVEGLPVRLYGGGNEAAGPVAAGIASHEELKQSYRDFRSFFCLGTFPASYTLGFIEAWMTGTPVVALGNALMYQGFQGPYAYEVPQLIDHGTNGFYADSVPELRATLQELLRDDALARRVSAEGRAAAQRLFGKETIKEEWRRFLAAL